MASIYTRGNALAKRLLKPESEGGMGQGVVLLARVTKGVPDPATPWIDPGETTQTEKLRAAVRGVDRRLVGTEYGSAVILASDRVAICAEPAMTYTAGDILSVDGIPVHVIAVENLPAAGTVCAVKFTIRG